MVTNRISFVPCSYLVYTKERKVLKAEGGRVYVTGMCAWSSMHFIVVECVFLCLMSDSLSPQNFVSLYSGHILQNEESGRTLGVLMSLGRMKGLMGRQHTRLYLIPTTRAAYTEKKKNRHPTCFFFCARPDNKTKYKSTPFFFNGTIFLLV